MSDYGENVADFESDLGTFAAEQEASGFDAVETTEAGRLLDSQLQNTAENGGAQYVIDTVAEARQAETHTKKENEKAANAREAIREIFARAHEHVDNHKYNLNLDGKDYEISHGELKDFMKKQSEQFAKRAKTEKDSKKRAQIEQDSQTLMRLYQHMSTQGPLNEDQLKEFSDVLDRNPELKAEFEETFENNLHGRNENNMSALERAKASEADILNDVRLANGETCLTSTMNQNAKVVVICEEPQLKPIADLGRATIAMSNYEETPVSQIEQSKLQNTGAFSMNATIDF